MLRKILGVAALAATLGGAASLAAASAAPYYASQHRLSGRVVSFGGYDLGLRVGDRVVNVDLHPGTIIHPTGLTLHRGMIVRVEGSWSREGFQADRITLVQ